jgi:DNA-binding beta-propeller fold protein YncE
VTFLVLTASVACSATSPRVSSVQQATSPVRGYIAYVVSEATDEIAVISFDSSGAKVVRKKSIGMMPADIDGPHGIAISPDGRYYYVTFGHGSPFGSLWKYDAKTDSAVGHVMLGLFPASVSLTPDGAFAYVANFNLYGGMAPSSVSIVATDAMLEVGRVTTCTMPHGSRVDQRGDRHYSVCMMDNQLVEIDAHRLERARTLDLGSSCSPTWAEPSETTVWVACNSSSELLEVDRVSWVVRRRIAAGTGTYNLALTRDGRRLVASNKRGHSVSVFDCDTGAELARIATTRTVVHGVAISADDRYAFVSIEGVGAEPGTVDIIDLTTLRRVASVDVGSQAAGIATRLKD